MLTFRSTLSQALGQASALPRFARLDRKPTMLGRFGMRTCSDVGSRDSIHGKNPQATRPMMTACAVIPVVKLRPSQGLHAALILDDRRRQGSWRLCRIVVTVTEGDQHGQRILMTKVATSDCRTTAHIPHLYFGTGRGHKSPGVPHPCRIRFLIDFEASEEG